MPQGQNAPDSVLSKDFTLIWRDAGQQLPPFAEISVWRPSCPPGYYSVGDVITIGNLEPDNPVQVYKDDTMQVRLAHPRTLPPEGFQLVWRDTYGLHGGEQQARPPVSIWRPIPPLGYAALGCVAIDAIKQPSRNSLRCIRDDLVVETPLYQRPVFMGKTSDPLDWYVQLW